MYHSKYQKRPNVFMQRQMSTHVRRAGMNKGLAATLFIAAVGAAYINSSINTNPYPSRERSVAIPQTSNKDEKKEEGSQTKENNPMVHEKVSSNDTKPEDEKKLEGYAKSEVRDTSALTKKDTDKVKPVWDDEKKKSVVANSPQENGGFWNNMFSSKDIPDVPTQETPNKGFEKASTINGNPMVYEKRSDNPTKPRWEQGLEEHAKHNVRDTSTLVGKDTEKVRGVWEDKAVRDMGRTPQQTENHAGSFWSHLFGKANDQVQHAENAIENKYEEEAKNVSGTWDNLKSKVNAQEETLSDKAHTLYQNAAHAVTDASQKLKSETDQAAAGLEQAQRDAYSKGAELKREASDRFKKQEDLSSQARDNAKSWYQKGAEEVKNTYGSVKSETSKLVQDKLKSNQQDNNVSGHVLRGEKFAEEEFGQLRPTRANTKLKPADLIVKNADGKEM